MSGDLTQGQLVAPDVAGNPLIPLPEISRRSFIKLLGIAMVGVAGALPGEDAPALPQLVGFATLPQLPEVAGLLLNTAFAELRDQGFPFSIDQASVVATPRYPNLIGVLLRDIRVPPSLSGANISLTVDLKMPQRSTLYYLVGESREEELLLRTTRLAPGGARLEHAARFARPGAQLVRGQPIKLMRQRPYRSEQLTDPADDGVCAGWREHSQWYYDYAGGASWLAARDRHGPTLHLRYTTTHEHRNSRDCTAPAGQRRSRRASGVWYSEARTEHLS